MSENEQHAEPIGPSLPAGPSGPPPGMPGTGAAASGRRSRSGRRPGWRLAVVATAFAVGCGATATVSAVLDRSGSHAPSVVAGSSSGGGDDSARSTRWGGAPGSSGSQGLDGSSGASAGRYGSFPQFGEFGGEPGQDSGSTDGATADSTSEATSAQSRGLVEITSTLAGGTAAGTGMVLTSSGIVVTNHHVVEGATSVKVTVVSTGTSYTATYVGGDATADVAVLRLSGASGLTTVDLADDAAQVGDAITSVGDANGDGGSLTASPGTVAALDQDIAVQDDDGGTSRLADLIELNAYIVPGDSGGAVLDAAGEVVAMNVAASSGGTAVVGYAIPVETVETLAQEILTGSTAGGITLGYPGYLGVGLATTESSATVGEVSEGEAAARAGIEAGDTITSFDGQPVTSASQLHDLVAQTSPGDRVTVGWTSSDGRIASATVTLGEGPIA